MVLKDKKIIGQLGEKLAKDYLIAQSYLFLDSNWRSGRKEIDLIFKKNGYYVFIEVKTRQLKFHDLSEVPLLKTQTKNLKKAMLAYCDLKTINLSQVRFDLILIILNGQKRLASLRHYLDIFN